MEKGDLLPSPEEEVGEGIFAAPLGAGHQIGFITGFVADGGPVKSDHRETLPFL